MSFLQWVPASLPTMGTPAKASDLWDGLEGQSWIQESLLMSGLLTGNGREELTRAAFYFPMIPAHFPL